MKHVKLPIYDGDNETNDHLEVSTALLEYIASSSVVWKDHVKYVQGPTPEQEIDMINRIIEGLPPKPDFVYMENKAIEERLASAHYRLHADGRIEQLVKHENLEWGPPMYNTAEGPVELIDVVSKYPEFTADDIDFNKVALLEDNWRPIPGFSKYEMSKYQMIAEKATGKSVSIIKGGRIDNVLLSDDNGITKRMSVKFLFEKTFPEY